MVSLLEQELRAGQPRRGSMRPGLSGVQQSLMPAAPAETRGMPPVRDKLYPGEDKFFRERPEVTGMAAADNSVILNPYSDPSVDKQAVTRNEQARILMRTGRVPNPQFSITPEQAASFAGTEYADDEQALRETIAARILTGDPSAGAATDEQRRFVGGALAPLSGRGSMRPGLTGVQQSLERPPAPAPGPPQYRGGLLGGSNEEVRSRIPTASDRLSASMEEMGLPLSVRNAVKMAFEVTPLNQAYNLPRQLAAGDYSGAAMSGIDFVPFGLAASLIGKTGKGAAKAVAGHARAPRNTAEVPNLREQSTYADAASIAKGEPHLVPGADGRGFIGAPDNVLNASDLQGLRSHFDDEVALGQSGADWYDAATKWNNDVTTSSRAAHGQSRNLALHSAQAAPETNLQFALKGDRSYAAGVPEPVTRTGAQARELYGSLDEGRDIALGPKTDIYSGHMDSTVPEPVTGTNDIWHARAFGYKDKNGKPWDKALSDTQHKFLDYETVLAVERANTLKLGGRSDWTPGRVQAAAWVTGKGRQLAAKNGTSLQEGIEEAKKAYGEYAHKHTVSMPSEQVPGEASGILKGMTDAEKIQFSKEAPWLRQTNRGPGQDASSPYDTFLPPGENALGAYENSLGKMEYNPVEISKTMVPMDDVKGVKSIPAYAESPLRAQTGLRGLLDMQEGSTFNAVFPGAGPRTAYDIQSGTLGQTDLQRMLTTANKHDMGIVSNTEGGMVMAHSDNFNPKSDFVKTSRGMNKTEDALRADLREIVGDAPVRRGSWQSDYIDLSKEMRTPGKGKMTDKVLKLVAKVKKDAPAVYEKMLDSHGIQLKAQANLDRYHRWSKKLGETERDDYVKLLNIVGEKKLRGLVDHVRKYGSAGLPAVALLALGLGQELPEEDGAPL